jgi:TonB family protein
MDRTELERLFERLLTDSEDVPEDPAMIQARASLSAALPPLPSAAPSSETATAARLAAYLDGALDPEDAERFVAGLLRAPDEIYEVEAAQSLLDRISARRDGVPPDLVAAVVGHVASEPSKTVVTAPRSRFHSWRSIGAIGGAIAAAAVVVATIEIMSGEDGQNLAASVPASPEEAAAPEQRIDPASVIPPSGESKDKAGQETPAPVYTAPNPPQPITSHAITAEDYPEASVRLQEQGSVTVRYVVGVDGNVTDCQVTMSSGYPRLDDAACQVVGRWRYRPATVLDNTPIAMWMTSNIVFQLR